MLAKTPRVPYRLSTFCMFVINKSAIRTIRLRIETRLSEGCTFAASLPKRALTRSPIAKREHHQENQRAPYFHRIDGNPFEQQRQHQRHVSNCHNHEQHHYTHGEGEVPLADSGQEWEERRASRCA